MQQFHPDILYTQQYLKHFSLNMEVFRRKDIGIMNAHIDTFPKKNAFNEINFKLALNFISKNDVSLDFERLQLGEV